MADPLAKISNKKTDQREPIPGRADQVQNNAGGYVFEISPLAQLKRFLVLGTEGGTYYVTEKQHTYDNVKCLEKALAQDGLGVVNLIKEVSLGGLAPKQEPTLFALAQATMSADPEVRAAAYKAVPEVCRTGTMLFQFCQYCENLRGWGPGLVKAVSSFYLKPEVSEVAYQAVKYRSRTVGG